MVSAFSGLLGYIMDMVDVGDVDVDTIVFKCSACSCFPSVAAEPIFSAIKWESLALFCSVSITSQNLKELRYTLTHDSCFLSFV